jgi:hypothetical protein
MKRLHQSLSAWVHVLSIKLAEFAAWWSWQILDLAWAGRILLFYLWLCSVFGIASLFVDASPSRHPRSKLRRLFVVVTSLISLGLLIAIDHTCLAIAYLFSLFCSSIYRKRTLLARDEARRTDQPTISPAP